MAEETEYFFFLKELFPDAKPELMRLLQGAAENAFLLRSDFYTIRDWVEIAGCQDQEVLPAVLLLMLVALEEGSLCIEVSTPALLRRLRDFVPEADATQWAERIQDLFDKADCSGLIGGLAQDHKPVIIHQVGEQRFLYFQKYLRAEMDFQRELNDRLGAPEESACDWREIIQEVLFEQPLRMGTQALQLDADQQLALGSALTSNFCIISGGPGTGKTSIVLTLLRCLVRRGYRPDRIALAAPTGRAAQRLSDALRGGLGRLGAPEEMAPADASLRGLAATTLHTLLAYRPNRNVFARHRENTIPADVVIVDEVSMVGLVLMAQLLQALDANTKVILLGDKDQLPSVDAGAVLATLVPDGRKNGFHGAHRDGLSKLFPNLEIGATESKGPLQNRVILLQTNHRSQEQIRSVAEAINRQDPSIVDRLPALQMQDASGWQRLEQDGGCVLLEQTTQTANEVRGFVQNWAERAYFHSAVEGVTLASLVESRELQDAGDDDVTAKACFRRLFALLDRFRLLTLVRESAWGCDEINRFLDLHLRPRLGGDVRAELFPGAPVLITRNDAVRGLNNGDVGITLRHRGGGLRVFFQRQDRVVSFPAESLPGHQLGFALTVHKSQGSEFDHVMVVLPPTGGKRLLTKELIYTAITRAKTLGVICSAREVLKFAVGRRIVRESGLLRY